MADPALILQDLVRHWWLLLLTTLLGVGIAGGYTAAVPSTYAASSYVLVAPAYPDVAVEPIELAQAYGRIVDQPEVLGAAASRLGVPVDELAERVEGSALGESPVVQLRAEAGEARLAASYATTTAERLVAFGNTQTTQTRTSLSIFSQAASPPRASAPRPVLVLAFGVVAGLLLGGMAVLAGVARFLPGDRSGQAAAAGTGTATSDAHTADLGRSPTQTGEVER